MLLAPQRMKPRRSPHAFVYRAGIGLAGTHITCDATGFPSDLIFLSHARALAPRWPVALSGARAGRRQIVTTELTLRLLGDVGEKLRSRALPTARSLRASVFGVWALGWWAGSMSMAFALSNRARVVYACVVRGCRCRFGVGDPRRDEGAASLDYTASTHSG